MIEHHPRAIARTVPLALPVSTNIPAWPAVFAIAFGTFVMVTSEFLPIGLLGSVAPDLGVTVGQSGLLLTAPGLVAAIAAPLLSLRARTVDRRTLLIALTMLIVVSDLVVALSPNLGTALVGRALLGAALGGYWAFAAAAGRRLVRDEDGTSATTLILGGISVGTVLGVPIGTMIGGMAGWRIAFGGAAGLASLVLVAELIFVPSLPGRAVTSLHAFVGVLAIPRVRLGFAAAALIAGGHFAAYAYLQPFLGTVRLPARGMTWLLAGYGIAGIAGTWIGGRVSGRNGHVVFVAVATIIALAITAAYLSAAHAGVAAMLVMIWGAAFGALPVCLQDWTYKAAPDRFETGAALTVTVFQAAVAGGAWLGGIAVDHVGIGAAYLGGSALAALAALLLAGSLFSRRGSV